MSTDEASAQEKIVLAAIDCIEEEGIQDVTVRSIAAKAGVNIAAINYYFRSKDNLMAVVIESTTKHFVGDLMEYLDRTDIDIRDRLRRLLRYLVDGAMRFPRISLANVYEVLVEGKEDAFFVGEFQTLLDHMLKRMSESMPGRDPGRLRFAVVQVLSAAMFPSLAPAVFRGFVGCDFREEEVRRAYVEFLVSTVVGPADAGM